MNWKARVIKKFRSKRADKDKYEQLANILLLGRSVDASQLLEAVDFANKTGIPSFHKVKLYLDLNQSPNHTTDRNPDPVIVERGDLKRYDALLGLERDTIDE